MRNDTGLNDYYGAKARNEKASKLVNRQDELETSVEKALEEINTLKEALKAVNERVEAMENEK